MSIIGSSTLKFATFGCWNEGCEAGSVQEQVAKKLKENEKDYKFLVLLGDNYYSKKNKLESLKVSYHDINLEEMKHGFDCLKDINIPKKLILGNHDIEEGVFQGCSSMKAQLKLPWYDIKFPYDFEDHFLFLNTNPQNYKIVKFIYLDTTIYDMEDPINTCYDRVINKSANDLIKEQYAFISKQLKSLNPETTNTVVFFGHQPLITFRFKKGKPSKNLLLLDHIFNLTKGLHKQYQFNYICADFHNFEEAYIEKKYPDNKVFKIHQIVFGTGGKTELDERYNPYNEDRCDPTNFDGYLYDMQNRYSSYTEPEYDFSIPPKKSNGYGEIIIDENGLNYNFIPINPDGISNWKNKYFKYKNKYLNLKSTVL
jgi:hypothetical protein